MRIVKFSVSHPVTVGMFTIALVLFGAIALRNLPIELLPEISYPALTVRTEYPGNAPIEVENLITRTIEEAVGVVGNVMQVRSVSKAGVEPVDVGGAVRSLINVPNPFAGATDIVFAVDRTSHVTIAVYDVTGREVAVVFRGVAQQGKHTVRWDGTNQAGEALPSGIYFFRLRTGNEIVMHKAMLLR